ncbi:MAG TPA: DUF177 domain-containing protein [Brumimicrobium sp.]|nr:DUF177 domain-containing protein [Brumimicrobium sp.]
MNSRDEYIIPFEGLKVGEYVYEFHVDDMFFEEFEYSIISGGNIEVVFTLEKKETMMLGHFNMSGITKMACDRCMEPMDIPVSVSHQIVFKFSDEENEDENLVHVPSSAFTIDISPMIYELLTVALPSRSVHEEKECNEEMLGLLNQYESFSENDDFEEEVDPRWNNLKKLK